MVRFKVPRINCGGCTRVVTRAVLGIEPGARIGIDLGAKLVTVSRVRGSADRIARAIAAAGYPAEPLPAAA